MPSADRYHRLWVRLGQLLIGAFFLASAYWKLSDGFFFAKTAPLTHDWQYWLDAGFTVRWYRPVLTWLMPYADIVASAVIAFHAIAGALLVIGRWPRVAGSLLLLVQINIFLATFFWWGFFIMVGYSIWLSVYYILLPGMTPRTWRMLSIAFLFFFMIMLIRRWTQNDLWPSSFPAHFANFQEEAMSVHPAIKNVVIDLSSTPMGRWIWSGMWWFQLLLLLLCFTRYRLIAAIAITTILMGRAATWMSVMAAEAVLHVLAWFCFVAEEARQQSIHGVRPLLPVQLARSVSAFVLRLLQSVVPLGSRHKPARSYPSFFCFTGIAIIVFFIFPHAFGLQNYNQWGGMYDEHWCNLDVYDGDPTSDRRAPIVTISAGFTETSRVYSGPMNNETTCLMWSRSRCGTRTQQGINISWAVPYLKGRRFNGERNVCDSPLPDPSPWFKHEK